MAQVSRKYGRMKMTIRNTFSAALLSLEKKKSGTC